MKKSTALGLAVLGWGCVLACGTTEGGSSTGPEVPATSPTGEKTPEVAPAKGTGQPGQGSGTGAAPAPTGGSPGGGAQGGSQGGQPTVLPPADGGTATDASPPAPPLDRGEAGKVTCGDVTCTLPAEVCCMSFGGSVRTSCKAPASCTGFSVKAACDGPEDCPNGQHCCSGFPQGSVCQDSCAEKQMEVCHATSECAQGMTCTACKTPGGGPKTNFCVGPKGCPF